MSQVAAFFRIFWSLARPYWTQSDEKLVAGLLLGVIVALNLANVALNVWFNTWYNEFYNALQEKDFDSFKTLLLYFTAVAVAFIVVAVYQYYLNQLLQLRWRRWLTETWLAGWLHDKRYYHMQISGLSTDNPDQRIAEDLRLFASFSLDILLGLMSSVVTLASFTHILWRLSGDLAFTLGGVDFHIPGYMVWVALAYSAAGTWITHLIGQKLVPLNFEQQRYEADFRFHLVRVREHAEGIALQHGEAAEARTLLGRFGHVYGNFLAIMRRQKMLIWFTSGYGQAATIFPFVVAAPRYFGGAIQLGGLMQIVSAFGQVQSAFSYLISAYSAIAEWRAVIDRLTGFRAGMERADLIAERSRIAVDTNDGQSLDISDLQVELPDGRPLLRLDRLLLHRGDRLLIVGRSGNGKTTVLRAIAGLWPYGRGHVSRATDDNCLFLPQMPYLPVGSLRAAIAYPRDPASFGDADYTAALQAMGLGHLAGRLDEESNWSQVLSGGEQQRLQLAGASLIRPAWLFLDEATSALDETSERDALTALRMAMPDSAVISVGHRLALTEFHEHKLAITPGEASHDVPALVPA